MKTPFYIIKAKDCFGDLWPIGLTSGVCGKSFDSKDEALTFLDVKRSTIEGRREMRHHGGWSQNTINSFQVHEIV